jgi:hypothetical protein
MRYVSKGIQELRNSVNRVPTNVLLATTLGAVLAAEMVGSVYSITDAPSEAIGSLLSGSVGSTVATSSAPTALSGSVWVADTNFDRTYPAWYGLLPSAISTGTAPKWSTVPFSTIPRST